MANIKVTIDYPIANGLPLTFKSPANCSQVTGMTVHYTEGGTKKSKTFQFADAHGKNVGSIDLFASNVLVKVILDVDASKAYVQNADTNAYLEGELAKKYSPTNKPAPEDLGAATTALYTATVTTTWTASGDYFYQDIAVNGILATDTPIVGINPGSDNAANVQYSLGMSNVFRITTSDNSIRVWARAKPTVAIPIQLKVVR